MLLMGLAGFAVARWLFRIRRLRGQVIAGLMVGLLDPHLFTLLSVVMRVVFLGTSTSYGVPVIGCRCATCTSTDPRNKRTRASVYVETDDGVRLLIDTRPRDAYAGAARGRHARRRRAVHPLSRRPHGWASTT